MAGIKVRQHEIFKINTVHLKRCEWNLNITRREAYSKDELIKLFDSQLFRISKTIINNLGIIDKESLTKKDGNIDWKKCFVSIVIDKSSDFTIARKGFFINGEEFKRLVGTTGGLKNNSVIFANVKILEELNTRMSSVDIKKNLVPAKYEAYKALTLSSSQKIAQPRDILVVSDCYTKYIDTIVEIDDSDESKAEPIIKRDVIVELENNATDGFNLCTINYMERVCSSLGLDYVSGGVCIRNKWLKGMMYPFPIVEFADKNNDGNYIVEDIWGNKKDIRNIDLILTESSLKLWDCYESSDSYIKNYKECGYEFSVTKISPDKLKNKELNYQYLQSFDFSDDDIVKLCKKTVDYLKTSSGGSYENVLNFLGITKDSIEKGTWQHALFLNKNMLSDSYVLDNIHKMIKKKINNAKIGKLLCHGNFQIFSNDPYVFMENVFKKEPKGLLKANECYSSYWKEKDVGEILAFRSPMSVHNNIRKLNVVSNDEINYWYQYMDNIFIVNSFDSFCKAENGEDSDGDTNYTTDNKILLKNFKELNAIQCMQRSAKKKRISEGALAKSNKLAFGNNVGEITNYITSMIEVQSKYDYKSEEYNILQDRIMCGQLYQQNCLDAIKGIIARPMPKYWYDIRACEKESLNSELCANKKPYFMIYRYPNEKKKYKRYIEQNSLKCIKLFRITLQELLETDLDMLTKEQKEFVSWYYKKMPIGINRCSMNKICYHIEKELDGYSSWLKLNSGFNYALLKYKVNNNNLEKENLIDLSKQYISKIANFKSNNTDANNKEEAILSRQQMKEWFKEESIKICKNEQRRMNMILDICYGEKGNKQFCWDTIGDLICKRLEELNEKTDIE